MSAMTDQSEKVGQQKQKLNKKDLTVNPQSMFKTGTFLKIDRIKPH